MDVLADWPAGFDAATNMALRQMQYDVNHVLDSTNAKTMPNSDKHMKLCTTFLNKRCAYMNRKWAAGDDGKAKLKAFGTAAGLLHSGTSAAVTTSAGFIKFGQVRVAPTFSHAGTEGQQGALVPAINGRTVCGDDSVAADLIAGTIGRDAIPVHIFWHAGSSNWVCENNRGFTAHAAANAAPLRVLPLLPARVTADITNRFGDTLIVTAAGDVPVFPAGADFPRAQLGNQRLPRRVPSDWEMTTVVMPRDGQVEAQQVVGAGGLLYYKRKRRRRGESPEDTHTGTHTHGHTHTHQHRQQSERRIAR